jgi:predicted RNA binding protein YcfA (HicA-like mRNA interferase family)
MPNGVFNWNFNDVVDVLKEHGFRLNDIEGSHYFYIRSHGGRIYQVCVPKHGAKSFKPRTLKGMVAQSGLTKAEWGL